MSNIQKHNTHIGLTFLQIKSILKTAFMYKTMIETHKRTLVRMISYRITAWLFTILWTYLYTGNLTQATGFSTLLHILLSVDYYFHERMWLKIKWGLVPKQQNPITLK